MHSHSKIYSQSQVCCDNPIFVYRQHFYTINNFPLSLRAVWCLMDALRKSQNLAGNYGTRHDHPYLAATTQRTSACTSAHFFLLYNFFQNIVIYIFFFAVEKLQDLQSNNTYFKIVFLKTLIYVLVALYLELYLILITTFI